MNENALWFVGLDDAEYMLYGYFSNEPRRVYLYRSLGLDADLAAVALIAIRDAYRTMRVMVLGETENLNKPHYLFAVATVQAMLTWTNTYFVEAGGEETR